MFITVGSEKKVKREGGSGRKMKRERQRQREREREKAPLSGLRCPFGFSTHYDSLDYTT
jgi:hypothetical protein